MPHPIKIKSIKHRLPVRYRFSPVVRIFMLSLSTLICAYSLYFLIRFVKADTPTFFKMLPLVIMFVALDSIFRQTTSLNSVLFLSDRIKLSYLLKPSIEIPYSEIVSMKLERRITFYFLLAYNDSKGIKKQFKTAASFPKMLEIILNIADLSPQVQLNEFMTKAVEHLRSQAEAENEQQV